MAALFLCLVFTGSSQSSDAVRPSVAATTSLDLLHEQRIRQRAKARIDQLIELAQKRRKSDDDFGKKSFDSGPSLKKSAPSFNKSAPSIKKSAPSIKRSAPKITVPKKITPRKVSPPKIIPKKTVPRKTLPKKTAPAPKKTKPVVKPVVPIKKAPPKVEKAPPQTGPSDEQLQENKAFCAQNPNSPKCAGAEEAPPQTGPSDEQLQENKQFCAQNPNSPKCAGGQAPPQSGPSDDQLEENKEFCAQNPNSPKCGGGQAQQPDLTPPEDAGRVPSLCEQNPQLPQCSGGREERGEQEPGTPGGTAGPPEFTSPPVAPPIAIEPPTPPPGGPAPSGPTIQTVDECPEGQFSYNGSCVPDTCPVGTYRMPDYTCVSQCYGRTTPTPRGGGLEAHCAPQCREGRLVEFVRCVEQCGPDHPVEVDGVCQTSCPEGQVPWGSQCVYQGNCPEGEVQVETGEPGIHCMASCPEGMFEREGTCIGTLPCLQQGGVRHEGQCLAQCPDGLLADNGECISECPPYLVQNGNVCESCPEGQQAQNGVCVTVNACDPSEVVIDGVCRPLEEVGYDEFIEACVNFGELEFGVTDPSLGIDYSDASPTQQCEILTDLICNSDSTVSGTTDLANAPLCQDRDPICDAGEYLSPDGDCVSSCDDGEYVVNDFQCASQCGQPYAVIGNECRAGCPRGYEYMAGDFGEESQCVADCPAGQTRLEDGSCGNPCPEGQNSPYPPGPNYGQCEDACPEGSAFYQGQCWEQCPLYNGPHTSVDGVCLSEETLPYDDAVEACQNGDLSSVIVRVGADQATCEAVIAERCDDETATGELEPRYCFEQPDAAPNGGGCEDGLVEYNGACISGCPAGLAMLQDGRCEATDGQGPPTDGVITPPDGDEQPPPTDGEEPPPVTAEPPITIEPPRPPETAQPVPPGTGGEPEAPVAGTGGKRKPRVRRTRYVAPPQPPRALAVVVSTARYILRGVPGKPHAAGGADAFMTFLREDMKLPRARIIRLKDLPRAGIEAFFGKRGAARSQLKAAVINARPLELIVYLSGHGMLVEGGADAVLLPADGDPVRPAATGYRLSTLYANIQALGVPRVRFYIDAAFNSRLDAQPVRTSVKVKPVVNYPALGPLGTILPSRWVTLMAASGNEPAYTGRGEPRSVFNTALLSGLRGAADTGAAGNGDGLVTSGELVAFTRSQVTAVVNQATGWRQTPRLFGHPQEVLFAYRGQPAAPQIAPGPASQSQSAPETQPAPAPQPVKPVEPSFDCNKARAPAEIAICTHPDVAALDNQMAELYYARRRALRGANRRALTRQQRQWLGQRNACGSDAACLLGVYRQRIQELQ